MGLFDFFKKKDSQPKDAKHTEILAIARNVMRDIGFGEMELKIRFQKDGYIITGPLKGQKKDVWVISMNFTGLAFLEILDETGEPLTFQPGMDSLYIVEKGEGGKYRLKEGLYTNEANVQPAHSQEEILKVSKTILNDLQIPGMDFSRLEVGYKIDNEKWIWVVTLPYPPIDPDAFLDGLAFLEILDQTEEPIKLLTSVTVKGIEKSHDGKYRLRNDD